MTVEPPDPPTQPDLVTSLERAVADDLVRERRLEGRELRGVDLEGRKLHNLHVRECRLHEVDFAGASAGGLDLADVVVSDGSWANLSAPEAVITRAVVTGAQPIFRQALLAAALLSQSSCHGLRSLA